MRVHIFCKALVLAVCCLAATQGRPGDAQQSFAIHRVLTASSPTYGNPPPARYPVVPTASPPVAPSPPSGHPLSPPPRVPSYPPVMLAPPPSSPLPSTPLPSPSLPSPSLPSPSLPSPSLPSPSLPSPSLPSPPPPRPTAPRFPPSSPCSDCQFCLDKLHGVTRKAFANLNPSNMSDVTALLFKDECESLPAQYTAGCARVAANIAQSVSNFLAARAGVLCTQLGACKASSACNNLRGTLPDGTAVSGKLDQCTQEGVAGGSVVTLPTVARWNKACRGFWDCQAKGDVCLMGLNGTPQAECFCEYGRDTCYYLGTCTPFCDLASTAVQLQRLNAGAQDCTPGNDTCGAGNLCVSQPGCRVWSCDTTTNSLVSKSCGGRCVPQQLNVISAKLVDSGAGVNLRLNAYATKLTNTPCEYIFDNATVQLLGGPGNAQCNTTNNILYVRLPANATIQPNQKMVLRSSGSLLTSQASPSATFSGNVTLQTCSNCATPNPVILGPSAMEAPCAGDNLLNAAAAVPPSFDASRSSHPSGRLAWKNVVWSVTAGPTAGQTLLSAIISRTNNITNPNDRLQLKLTLNESIELAEGQGYTIRVTLTSWLGTTNSTSFVFKKEGSSSPPAVKVVGPRVQQFLLSSGLRVGAEAGQVCAGKAVNWLWTSTWAGFPGNGVATQQLYLAPPLLAKHGTEIKLRISASYSGSNISSYDEVTMVTLGSKPIARVRGPSGKVPSNGTLIFNATSSRDPDITPDLQQLQYSWECRREDYPNPCFNGAEQGDQSTDGVWQIPASLLTTEIRHTIIVTVNKVVPIGTSPLASTASTEFELSAPGSFPTGNLTRQCSPDQCAKPHNTADDLVVLLTLDTDFITGTTVVWESKDVPGISTLTAVRTVTGAIMLSLPSAILPTNLDEISITAKLTWKGVGGLAFLKVSLDAPPFCTLGEPSQCLQVILDNDQYPQAVATISAIGWRDYLDGTDLTYEFGTVNGSNVNLQQSGSTTTAVVLGLFYGQVTLYGCAVDSGGGRTCASVTITVRTPPATFDARLTLSSINISSVTSSRSRTKLFGAANQCGCLFRWFQIFSSFGHHRRLGRMLQTTEANDAVSTQTIGLINAIMEGTNLEDLEQVKLTLSSVTNTANNAANLLTAEAAKTVLAALDKLITALSSSSNAAAVSTTAATQVCSVLAAAVSPTLIQDSSISWLKNVASSTSKAAAGLGKQAVPGSFLAAGTDGIYISAAALALTGDSFAYTTVRSGPTAGATAVATRRSTLELLVPQVELQPYPRFQLENSVRKLQEAGASSSNQIFVAGVGGKDLDGTSAAGESSDALPYSRRSLITTSTNAEAVLTFSGSSAVDASTFSLGLTHVTQVKDTTAVADVLVSALGSSLPSDVVLASGMVDVRWSYVTSSSLPEPTLDGTNSYITLTIPATSSYNDAKVKACLQYDSSSNTIQGSLSSLTAGTATATFVGYDGNTGLVTCRITAPGTYIVGLAPPRSPPPAQSSSQPPAGASSPPSTGASSPPPVMKEEKTEVVNSPPPEKDSSSIVIGGIVGGVGGAMLIAVIAALVILQRRQRQSIRASNTVSVEVGPGGSRAGGSNATWAFAQPPATDGSGPVTPVATGGNVDTGEQPQGNYNLSPSAGDFVLPNTPKNAPGRMALPALAEG
ncbi:hypothetical protein VaNZ11_003092 [Volvox africanus]|uniref:PKD/REJ-like domain-containing protein n=1 Tax=Volvox africanus TaxID=51714 RepID=A0ABQ5RUK0_9CHLO|nr:hypothetical protein VaNZ11_003092 [Volvox africanus]